jgi:hypothetical protein
MSYFAQVDLTLRVSIFTLLFFCEHEAPRWLKSVIKVLTSATSGTLESLTGVDDKRVTAKSGRAAFLAPEISTVPLRG